MEGLWRDVRWAQRALSRSPGFTAVAVLTLALGIGANTAIFGAVNAVLLRPLRYLRPERLVAVFTHETSHHEPRDPTSPADFIAWREGNRVFDDMTAAWTWSPSLTGLDRPDRLTGLKTTLSLFRLLGVEPARGRVFTPAEPEDHVVVLGHRLWVRRFGSDPGVLGRKLTLDGEPYTVIGVMPPGFRFPPFWFTEADLWAPLELASVKLDRNARYLRVFARLKPGVTLERAQSEMDVIARGLAESYPDSNAGIGVNVEPLQEPAVSDVRPALLVLLGAVGLVLLIACANVANLALARGEARGREIAVRALLGAGRLRLARLLLAESLLLSLFGGSLGLLLALWLSVGLGALAPPEVPRLDEIGLDRTVLFFSIALSLGAGVGFGLVPALRTSHTAGALSLRSPRPSRVDRVLVAGEVALALTLLIGAGLLMRSFVRLSRLDPGFRVENVLTFGVSFEGTSHADRSRQATFLKELLGRVETLPGVQGAAVVSYLPIGDDEWRTPFTILGRPLPQPADTPVAVFRMVSPDYFRVLGIPLVAGRGFGPEDGPESPGVIVVNETMARRFWPGESAVGKRIRPGGADSSRDWLTIVGVASDAHQWSLTRAVRPEICFPYAQQSSPFAFTRLVVLSKAETAGMASAVQEKIWSLDPDLPVTDIRPMEQILSRDLAPQRFNLTLVGFFSTVALALAAVGIYGVVAHAVGRRTRELAIRIAMGARPADVLRHVLREGLAPAMIGVIIGLGLALALGRHLSALLYEIRPTDPATLVAVAFFLTAVAFAACYLAARKADSVDPMAELRHE